MTPEKAVQFAIIGELGRPIVPNGDLSIGFFVYVDTITADELGVVAYDAQNEVPHHFRLQIEKVDD